MFVSSFLVNGGQAAHFRTVAPVEIVVLQPTANPTRVVLTDVIAGRARFWCSIIICRLSKAMKSQGLLYCAMQCFLWGCRRNLTLINLSSERGKYDNTWQQYKFRYYIENNLISTRTLPSYLCNSGTEEQLVERLEDAVQSASNAVEAMREHRYIQPFSVCWIRVNWWLLHSCCKMHW